MVRVGPVHAYRFGLLRLVPDVDLVGLDSDEAFVREVVPAQDGQRRSNAKPARSLDVINLVGADIHERRDEQHVWLFVLDDTEDRPVDWDGAFDGEQRAREKSVSGAAAEDRPLHDPSQQRRRLAARPLREAVDTLVLGRQVAHVIDGVARRAGETEPEAPRCLCRDLAGSDVGEILGELRQEPLVALFVLVAENEVDAVIPLGQRLERRCEIPQRPGMAHGEQDSHLACLKYQTQAYPLAVARFILTPAQGKSSKESRFELGQRKQGRPVEGSGRTDGNERCVRRVNDLFPPKVDRSTTS